MAGPLWKKDSIRIRLCVPSIYNLRMSQRDAQTWGLLRASERKGRVIYGDSGAVKTCLESFLED